MKLGDARDVLDDYSKSLSERVRWLAGAGLAFVWVLAGGQLVGLKRDLLAIALLLVGTLLADFAHYGIGWARWELFVRRAERKHGPNEQAKVGVPESTLGPIYWAYYLKLGFIVAAYMVLGIVIAMRLAAPGSVCV